MICAYDASKHLLAAVTITASKHLLAAVTITASKHLLAAVGSFRKCKCISVNTGADKSTRKSTVQAIQILLMEQYRYSDKIQLKHFDSTYHISCYNHMRYQMAIISANNNQCMFQDKHSTSKQCCVHI